MVAMRCDRQETEIKNYRPLGLAWILRKRLVRLGRGHVCLHLTVCSSIRRLRMNFRNAGRLFRISSTSPPNQMQDSMHGQR